MEKEKLSLYDNLKAVLADSQIYCKEPMSRHTTFRIGGPADYFLMPEPSQVKDVLRLCADAGVPLTVVGNGSNLLVGDGGIRGVVLAMDKPASTVRTEGCRIRAGAGALLSQVAHAALGAGLGGMEFAAGIPGSVGGAVVMNAGAYGGEMKDVLSNVRVLMQDGEERVLDVSELELSYRHSCIPEHKYIVLEAEFDLHPEDQQEIRSKMEDLRRRRIEKQPLEYPSAGSTFKRPQGYFAGKLIMDAGLAGFTVGGAQVSEKHCGFVINKGNATAADVLELVRRVQQRVKQQFGVEMELEVKYIGEDNSCG